jgi:hypothetical protein
MIRQLVGTYSAAVSAPYTGLCDRTLCIERDHPCLK